MVAESSSVKQGGAAGQDSNDAPCYSARAEQCVEKPVTASNVVGRSKRSSGVGQALCMGLPEENVFQTRSALREHKHFG